MKKGSVLISAAMCAILTGFSSTAGRFRDGDDHGAQGSATVVAREWKGRVAAKRADARAALRRHGDGPVARTAGVLVSDTITLPSIFLNVAVPDDTFCPVA